MPEVEDNSDCAQRTESTEGDDHAKPKRKWLCRFIITSCIGFGLGLILVALFVLNGTVLDRAGTPEIGITNHAASPAIARGQQIRIVAYNIAKAFVYGGGKFQSKAQVRERLDHAAELIRAEDPDLVFLSEAMRDCGPCPVNQIEYLADQTGMHSWAFGENYNIGLPFYRIAGGNGILSRFPLAGVANIDLPFRKPFYVTKNNRRTLICSTEIGGADVLLAAMHTDSFDLDRNAAQAEMIIEALSLQPAICAGDFNAMPETRSIGLFKESGRFTGEWNGPFTFPSDGPNRTIDYVLGPVGWKLVEHKVITNLVSDHCAVLSVFDVR